MRPGDIIRVFPRRTSLTPRDELAFVGDPPLFRPEAGEVHVSCSFSWDVPEAYRLAEAWRQYYPVVKVGGPAIAGDTGEFVPGRYLRQGVTFTSRGCPRHCHFCLVPEREGVLRLLDPISDGYIIQDNNFAACPRDHRRKAYTMLARQRHSAIFSGGIDARLVTNELAAEFRGLRIAEVFLAADSWAALRPLETAVRQLSFLPRRKLRCYMLCAYAGETPDDARRRLEAAWKLGVLPFAQLYQPPERYIDYPPEWRQLQREWSRPAAMFASHKEDEQGVPYATQ